MEIKVLGTGCAKCQKLYTEVRAVLDEGGVAAELSKVETVDEIISYGVMMTPALVVDGEVKSSGKLPSRDKLRSWLGVRA